MGPDMIWSHKELRIIEKYWILESDEQLTKRLPKRTADAILHKRMKLGLHSPLKSILKRSVVNC